MTDLVGVVHGVLEVGDRHEPHQLRRVVQDLGEGGVHHIGRVQAAARGDLLQHVVRLLLGGQPVQGARAEDLAVGELGDGCVLVATDGGKLVGCNA